MARVTASAPSGPSSSPRGRPVGRYVLYDEIASGGMASIHLARLIGPVGFSRTVAIKRPHPHLARQPAFVSMFVEEARLAARIRHPNVVPTIDVVVDDDELFLVMEYVTGESLRGIAEVLANRGQRMPLEVAVSIVTDALYGLHAAHEARGDSGELLGIVHRDVSPHNVMVGSDGIARLVDFGVAKALSRADSTTNGQLKGKLAYMAPEQLEGLPIDRRTDVFAASVVLWELVTGTRLFGSASEGEIARRILGEPIAAPSERAPNLPRAIDTIVLRGLDRDRERRYPTAEDMARALEMVVKPAPRADVASFVSDCVGAILDGRAGRIAEIERASAGSMAPAHATPSEVQSRPSDERPSATMLLRPSPRSIGVPDVAAAAASDVAAEGRSADVGAEQLLARTRDRRPVHLAGAALAGVAVTLLAVIGIGLVRRPTARDSAPVETAVATSIAAEPEREAPPVAFGSSASAGSAGPAAASAAPPPTSARAQPHRAGPRSPHAVGSATGCNVPYYFDHDGVKRFKPGCL